MTSLSEYLSVLEYRVKKQSNTSAHSDYLKKELNLAIQTHANLTYPWRELRRKDSVTLSSGVSEYILPKDFGEMILLWHEENSSFSPISLKSPDDFFQSSLSTTETANEPLKAILYNKSPVLEQPTAASTLRIASSSSTDKEIKITIYGIVEGYPDYETLTTDISDGTTLVSSTKQFSRIDGISKTSETTGRITVSTATQTLAVLPTGKLSQESLYNTILFNPIPASTVSVYFLYLRKQYNLINDTDFCILDDKHDNAILFLAQFFVYGEKFAYDNYVREVKHLIGREPHSRDVIPITTKLDDNLYLDYPRFGNEYAYPIN